MRLERISYTDYILHCIPESTYLSVNPTGTDDLAMQEAKSPEAILLALIIKVKGCKD